MFNKKSDYALNKREKDAIVYIGSSGIIYLTHADFPSKDEFLKWKNWSDKDYQASEQIGRRFYDNAVPFDDRLNLAGTVVSVEEQLIVELEKAEYIRLCAALLEHIRSCLTAKQFRRIWLLYIEGLTMTSIALAEGVSEPSISESISSAKKKILTFLIKHPIEIPFFL